MSPQSSEQRGLTAAWDGQSPKPRLMMNCFKHGTVKNHQKISDTKGGFTGILDDFGGFGILVAGLRDLDGDGTQDIAVGAFGDDDGGSNRGAVWVLILDGAPIVPIEPSPSEDLSGTHVLEAVYPNPFNPEATFRFAAYEQQSVRADLIDALGRVVATLFEGDVAAGQVQTGSYRRRRPAERHLRGSPHRRDIQRRTNGDPAEVTASHT